MERGDRKPPLFWWKRKPRRLWRLLPPRACGRSAPRCRLAQLRARLVGGFAVAQLRRLKRTRAQQVFATPQPYFIWKVAVKGKLPRCAPLTAIMTAQPLMKVMLSPLQFGFVPCEADYNMSRGCNRNLLPRPARCQYAHKRGYIAPHTA